MSGTPETRLLLGVPDFDLYLAAPVGESQRKHSLAFRLGQSLLEPIIVIVEFFKTGLVPRLPSAVLAVGLVLCGLLSVTVGLILHSIARRAQEFEYQLQVLAEELRHANR